MNVWFNVRVLELFFNIIIDDFIKKMVRGRRTKTINTNAKDSSVKRKKQPIVQHKLQEDRSITDYFTSNCFEHNRTTYDDCTYTTPNKQCNEHVVKTEFEENKFKVVEDNFLMLDNVKNLTKILSPSTPHRIQLCPDAPEHNLLDGIITSNKIKSNFDIKIKSKLKKIENDNKIPNGHKLTEYFPIRRSVRKTKRTVLEEKQKNLEQLLRDGIEEGLEVHNFEGKGRGVIAVRPFNRGDFVVEYSGELLDVTSAKKREELYSQDANTGCYMYYFKYGNQQYCVDATAESGKLGRLVNHSRNGNLLTRTITVDGLPRLVLIAKEYIGVGKEICYDYGDRSKESLKNHPWLAS